MCNSNNQSIKNIKKKRFSFYIKLSGEREKKTCVHNLITFNRNLIEIMKVMSWVSCDKRQKYTFFQTHLFHYLWKHSNRKKRYDFPYLLSSCFCFHLMTVSCAFKWNILNFDYYNIEGRNYVKTVFWIFPTSYYNTQIYCSHILNQQVFCFQIFHT